MIARSQSAEFAHAFPTTLHQHLAEAVSRFFTAHAQVDTVLLVNSCARGQAVPQSDLDLAVLVQSSAAAQDVQGMEASGHQFMANEPLVAQFKRNSRYGQVHLDFFNGQTAPTVWDDGGGPDSFEVEIGNRVAYAVPLTEAGTHFRELQSRWLPYYENDLRLRRLAMVREACALDLERVSFFVSRSLYFAAFDHLYKAFREFLQALFMARRTYPLAYNKWVRLQVEQWLGLAELYRSFAPILSIRNIESAELLQKAAGLKALLARWVQPG